MKKWKIALPILSLITLSYLAILTVKVFAHPKPEDVTDAEHVNFHLVDKD
jgi:hypothetical protein